LVIFLGAPSFVVAEDIGGREEEFRDY